MSPSPRRRSKALLLGSLALAGVLCAGAAQAGSNVYWSIQFGVPAYPVGVGAVVGNVAPPIVMPAPVYVAPPAMIYAPAPVVYAPRPVVVVPRPWGYAVPVYPRGKHGKWRHGHGHPYGVRHGD